MSVSPVQSARNDELNELIAAVWNGTIRPEQRSRLEELLAGDEAAQRRYLACMAMHANLLWQYRGRTAPTIRWPDAVQAAPSFPVSVSTVPAAHAFPFGNLISGWPVAYLIASVIFAIGLLIGAIVHVSQPASIVLPSHSGRGAGGEGGASSPSSSIVARVTGMVDCVVNNAECRMLNAELKTDIHPSSFINHHSPLHLGDRLALKSGLLELTYDTGAKVILQGPVTYEVESAAGGYLAVGKLTAKLEKRSGIYANSKRQRGSGSESGRNQHSSDLCPLTSDLFAVRTPTATVTDLGTEFGVEVTKEGTSETRVFAGTVEIATSGHGRDGPKKLIVRAGSAVRTDNGGNPFTMIGADEQRFVRSMSARAARPSAEEEYASLVLSMKPFAYYRLERPRDEKDSVVLFDSAPGGHHGVLSLAKVFGSPWEQGRFGDAMFFHGSQIPDDEMGDGAVVHDYREAERDQLTVSAWAMLADRHDWSLIAADWRERAQGQFFLGTYADSGSLGASIRQRDGTLVHVHEGHSGSFPPGQWQHVAFVVDKSVLRLYRNGVEVAAGPCDGLQHAASPSSLMIGRVSMAVAHPSVGYIGWLGRIDEIAVFHRALSATDIERLRGGGLVSVKRSDSN